MVRRHETMNMSNSSLDVRGHGDDHLLAALRLAYAVSGHSTAIGFIKRGGRLDLLWQEERGVQLFPVKMPVEPVLPMVMQWLAENDPTGVERGWRVRAGVASERYFGDNDSRPEADQVGPYTMISIEVAWREIHK